MTNFKKISKSLFLATAITGVMAGSTLVPGISGFSGISAQAQEYSVSSPERAAAALAAKNARPKTKSAGFSERVYKILSKAQEFMEMDPANLTEAMAVLKKQNLERVNSTERASFYQLMAAVEQNRENYGAAVGYYGKVLEQNNISYAMKDNITLVLGQLSYQQGDTAGSLKYLYDWLKFQPTPSMTNITIFANIHYAAGTEDGVSKADADKHFRTSIEFLNWAIRKAKADGKEDKENWYGMLRALHNNLEESDKVLELAELLATRWPKKQYWAQLSGLYAQKSSEDGLSEAEATKYEKKQLASFELMARQNMLETGREHETMAQLYLYHEAPYNSSQILEKSFEKELSEKNQKNYNLMAMAYINGKDMDKAVLPLSQAAALSDDGNLYIQLANVFLNLDQYTDATAAIDKGLAKGGVRRPDQSRLLQGQAYLSLEMFDEARKSFREAEKDDRSKKMARQLLKYVDNEEKRIKDIKEYLS